MDFGKKQVKHLADLAKLKLSDDELKTYSSQLKDILVYVDKLNELDLENIQETLSGVEDSDIGPRPDSPEKSQPEIIKQACQTKDNYIVASNVFDN